MKKLFLLFTLLLTSIWSGGSSDDTTVVTPVATMPPMTSKTVSNGFYNTAASSDGTRGAATNRVKSATDQP